ncbi:MAG: hypothetical protein ACRDTC_18830 [Pseudonocardiaceae bacterium]
MGVSEDRALAFELAALTRIVSGEVSVMTGRYLGDGFVLPDHLVHVVDQLILEQLVVTGDGDPRWDIRTVTLTEAGWSRYRLLSAAAESTAPRDSSGAIVDG